MKTLKAFDIEWIEGWQVIVLYLNNVYSGMTFVNEQQAFDWLEVNGYIERTKEDDKIN